MCSSMPLAEESQSMPQASTEALAIDLYNRIAARLEAVACRDETRAEIADVSPELFAQLYEQEPCWDVLRVEYRPKDQYLIVKFPLHTKEIVHDLVTAFTSNMPLTKQNSIRYGGAADVWLKDGTLKSPDASFYDMTPPRRPETIREMAAIQSNPTMVWEIALTETAQKLAKDCGRWIAASCGMIGIAIGICIDCGTADEDRVLKKVTVSRWDLSGFNTTKDPTPEDLAKANCGVVQRGDGKDDENRDIPERFTFSIYNGKTISTWEAKGKHTVIYTRGEAPRSSGSVPIYNIHIRQLARQPADWTEDNKIFARISYPEIINIIQKSVERQRKADLDEKEMSLPGIHKISETAFMMRIGLAKMAQVMSLHGKKSDNLEKDSEDDSDSENGDGPLLI